VQLDLTGAAVTIKIDGTEAFRISGDASFTIGGSDGFRLDSIRVNGFSIFGVGATISSAASPTRFLRAHIASPFAGQQFDRDVLNAQHYIDVVFDDPNARGLTGITVVG